MSSPRKRWLLAVCAVAALSLWGWFDVRRRADVDPDNPSVHKTDFTVYTEAGAAFFDGRDPYLVTNPRGWGYLYPPLFAILVAPLHHLEPHAQVMIWFFLSLLVAWGCWRESGRIARLVAPADDGAGVWPTTFPRWIAWAALATVSLPALNCLQRGQIGLAKLYLLLLGFRLVIESRTWRRSLAGGLVLALPIVLKVTPILPVGVLVFQQFVAGFSARDRSAARQRFTGCTAGLAAGLFCYVLLIPASLVGWQANWHHLHTWWNLVAVKADDPGFDQFAGDSQSVRNQSFSNAARRFGNWADFAFAHGPDDRLADVRVGGSAGHVMSDPRAGVWLLAARVALTGLLLAPVWWTARRQDRLGEAASFGLALAATLVVSPISRGHYFVLLLPAVVYLPWWLARERALRAARWLAFAPAVLCIAHYALMDYTGRVGLLGIGTTAWYVAGIVIMTRVGRSQRQVAVDASCGAGVPPADRREDCALVVS